MIKDTRLKITTDVLAQEVSGEMVLLDLNTEQYLGLNEVGARVWQLLEVNTDLNTIHESLLNAPNTKWTLDICIDQADAWRIHFSQLVPWPENFKQIQDDWHSQIINDPDLNFTSYALEENEAIIFCGSNQWHYRDRIARQRKTNFCHLLFLHYIPASCTPFLDPTSWAENFAIPELKDIDYTS